MKPLNPMTQMRYRRAERSDIPQMAGIWGLEKGEGGASEDRMTRYFDGEHHPQQALMPRVMYVAQENDAIVGYIAGHLTRRFACDGELEWIYVTPQWRRNGVASGLLLCLADWFKRQNAFRVCVNVARTNAVAHSFYTGNGADVMNQYWRVWKDITELLEMPGRITRKANAGLR